MKKPVKRGKSKSASKRAGKSKTAKSAKSKSAKSKTKKTTKAKAARKSKKRSVAPKGRSKLKTVAKRAATAAVVAGGLAALDAALGALKPKEGAASDKTEPKE
jgi:hypothetical protein